MDISWKILGNGCPKSLPLPLIQAVLSLASTPSLDDTSLIHHITCPCVITIHHRDILSGTARNNYTLSHKPWKIVYHYDFCQVNAGAASITFKLVLIQPICGATGSIKKQPVCKHIFCKEISIWKTFENTQVISIIAKG